MHKRKFVPGIMILVLAIVMAACGNEAENTSPSASANAQEETRLFVDAQGREVEIPSDPQRVVALWTVGEMIALGQKPVGSTANLLRYYTEEEKAGIEIVGEGVAGDYEKVLAMNPDLIVTYARATADELETYGKIAPTITTPFFGDPIATFRMLGDALNKEETAEQWIADYDSRVQEMREKTASLELEGKTALIVQFAKKDIYLYKSSTFPVLYDAYQFKLTDKQAELEKAGEFGSTMLSQEVLPEFNADYLFVIVNDEDSRGAFDELKKSAVWSGLAAVEAGHAYEIGNRISINDITTMDWALDEVYRLLTNP
ncbi:ABC transporter substrate-binding protein [Cohnella fermenti]|uniref:ABC transporter substrate-binding protein n=1 Tax=Cohnella fermenti TaxID=2565925 RepID=UPI001454E2FC|nr:ABC transporter substrate-binding protein [Cohnella fermenti]